MIYVVNVELCKKFALDMNSWELNNEISFLRRREQHGNDVDQELSTHKVRSEERRVGKDDVCVDLGGRRIIKKHQHANPGGQQ